MFARSTTITGDPAAMDAGIDYVTDEVMPTLTAMEGCLGVSMLVDRGSGQCVVTSSWSSEESMRASDLHLAPLRRQGSDIIGGAPQIELWEVASMHREYAATEGSCCRVTWMRLPQGEIDRGIGVYRSVLLPEMETIPGFCSSSLLVNRAESRACASTTYESRQAMEASRERAWALRDTGVREAGVDVLDVIEYDLVLAHLRLPERV